MTDAARPEQRKVTARIYTPSGWILATFHVPTGQGFTDFLNASKDFFALTEVQLPRQTKPLAFLALQRTAAILLMPEDREIGEPEDGSVTHQVSCLLEGGVLMGALRLPESMRVSDHLMDRSSRFLVLRDCTVGLDAAGGNASVEAASVAIVNSGRVVGVSEM